MSGEFHRETVVVFASLLGLPRERLYFPEEFPVRNENLMTQPYRIYPALKLETSKAMKDRQTVSGEVDW